MHSLLCVCMRLCSHVCLHMQCVSVCGCFNAVCVSVGELFHVVRNEIRPHSMQSAVWPLSEPQISAGDFIPAETGSARVQLRARARHHVDERGRDRPRLTRKEQKF